MANDVIDYVRYVTGSGVINNHITLKNQIINIHNVANIYDKYTSDVDIEYKAGSNNYTVTINDDLCATFMHAAIYWDNYYDFKFNVDKLEFELKDKRKVFISNK